MITKEQNKNNNNWCRTKENEIKKLDENNNYITKN